MVRRFDLHHGSLAKSLSLLFNIAQALRLSGKCGEAVTYYERYREQAQDLPQGFDEAFEKARRCANEEPGHPKAETPRLEPEPKSASPDVRTGDVPSPAVLPPAPAPPAATPIVEVPPQRSTSNFGRTLGVSLVALGGASAVGAVLGAVESRKASEQTATLSQRGGSWDDAAQANEASGRTWATWSIALTITSAASLGTGLWLLLRPDGSHPAATLTATATPSGATVSWSAAF